MYLLGLCIAYSFAYLRHNFMLLLTVLNYKLAIHNKSDQITIKHRLIMAQKKNSLDKQAQKLWSKFKDSAQFWEQHAGLLRDAKHTHHRLKSPPKPIDLPELEDTEEPKVPSITPPPKMPTSLKAKPVSVYNTVYGQTSAEKSDLKTLKAYVILSLLMVGLPILLMTLSSADEIFGDGVSPQKKRSVKTTMVWFEGYEVNQDFQASYDSLRVDDVAWKKHELLLLKAQEKEQLAALRIAYEYKAKSIQKRTLQLQHTRQKLWAKQRDFANSYQIYRQQVENKKEDIVVVTNIPQKDMEEMEKITPACRLAHSQVLLSRLKKGQTPRNLGEHNRAAYELFMSGDTLIYFVRTAPKTLHRVRKYDAEYYKMGKAGQLTKVDVARQKVYQAYLTFTVYSVADKPLAPAPSFKAVLYKRHGEQKQFYIPQSEWLSTYLHLNIQTVTVKPQRIVPTYVHWD